MSQKPLNAKELVAELRENAKILLDDHDRSYEGFANSFLKAADYIERTAPPTARAMQIAEGIVNQWRPTARLETPSLLALTVEISNAITRERTAPPADGLPEFETTAEERAEWQADVNDRLDPRLDCNDFGRLLADVTKAIAFAASETKRADYYLKDSGAAWDTAERNRLDRDREAAARRTCLEDNQTITEMLTHQIKRAEQAEAERATLRTALELIADRRLSDPLEFREIARAALATTK